MLLVAIMATPSHGQNFDIVLLSGRVMEPETQFDAVRNVGIKAGRIAVFNPVRERWLPMWLRVPNMKMSAAG
jgi:hypothetical protein